MTEGFSGVAENGRHMSSESTEFNNYMPVGPYLGGLCYFIFFVVVGSYLFFQMPFL